LGAKMKNSFKIMLIDNDVENSTNLSEVFADLKLKDVTYIDSANAAILEHKHQNYDLTFVNCDVHNLNQLEILSQIACIKPRHYAIMCKSNPDRDFIKTSIKHGATGFLTEPYTAKKILHEIDKYIMFNEEDFAQA